VHAHENYPNLQKSEALEEIIDFWSLWEIQSHLISWITSQAAMIACVTSNSDMPAVKKEVDTTITKQYPSL